jgi:hypothetical protein
VTHPPGPPIRVVGGPLRVGPEVAHRRRQMAVLGLLLAACAALVVALVVVWARPLPTIRIDPGVTCAHVEQLLTDDATRARIREALGC